MDFDALSAALNSVVGALARVVMIQLRSGVVHGGASGLRKSCSKVGPDSVVLAGDGAACMWVPCDLTSL